jgi:hypothetical protein
MLGRATIHRGHWTYDPRYTTGIELAGIPLEELVFFLVVPTCALLADQSVVRLLPSPGRTRDHGGRIVCAPVDDLAFGFALVTTTIALWRRGAAGRPGGP